MVTRQSLQDWSGRKCGARFLNKVASDIAHCEMQYISSDRAIPGLVFRTHYNVYADLFLDSNGIHQATTFKRISVVSQGLVLVMYITEDCNLDDFIASRVLSRVKY